MHRDLSECDDGITAELILPRATLPVCKYGINWEAWGVQAGSGLGTT